MSALNRIALICMIIGALDWLSVALFDYNFINAIFPGNAYVVARIIYFIVGIAGLYSIGLLFSSPRTRETS